MIKKGLDYISEAFRRPNNTLAQLIIINSAIWLILDGIIGTTIHLALGLEASVEFYKFKSWFLFPGQVWGDEGFAGAYLLRQPWSILTSVFMHGDIWHLLGNMVGLYIFGRIINEFLGSQKVLSIFLLGGIAGCFTFFILSNIPEGPFSNYALLLGASGGVYAIVIAAATLMPNYRIHLIMVGPVKLIYIAAFYLTLSYVGLMSNPGGNLAHLGGAFFGFLFIKQLQGGRDLGSWVEPTIQWIKDLFKPKSKIRVTYRNPNPKGNSSKRKSTADKRKSSASASGTTQETSQDEIDAILDKITEAGYDSLTKEEKQKLFNAGN